MNTSSIYLNAGVFVPGCKEDEIAWRYSELRTCEQLLSMGYNYSSGTNLVKRAKELEARISQLESQLKKG